jgi:hypothetical protein
MKECAIVVILSDLGPEYQYGFVASACAQCPKLESSLRGSTR